MMVLNRIFVLFMSLWGSVALAQFPPPPERKAEPTVRDIAYALSIPAKSKGNLLDLYLPPKDTRPYPLVIWTSGSAFLGDNGKEGARYMAPELLAAGFAVAGVSVRSSAQVKFPGQVHDIKAAIRFLRANAAQYGIDPARIAIMGDSSGGWMTSMATLTGDAPQLEGKRGTPGISSAVQAGVALYPPTDFLSMDRWAPSVCEKGNSRPGPGMCHDDPKSPESLLVNCAIQTCPAKARAADPATYVSEKDPPLMIMHGRADALVPHAQGEHLFKSLVQKCRTAVFYSLPLAGHGPPWSFLESDAVRSGATVETSSAKGCKTSLPAFAQPGWPAVIAFLRESLE
jgi:acetyl esterase/lipase